MHPLNWTVETKQSATSTSDLAKQAALEGAPHGSGYLAIEQTAGRGRRGRHWSSLEGGMYLSVILRPSVKKKYWFALSFAASLAALDAVRYQLARHFDNQHMPQTGLKWPNDVIMSGGKIAGILLESEGPTLVVGSGINIAPVRPEASLTFQDIILQAMVSGDRRPYLVALIVTEPEIVKDMSEEDIENEVSMAVKKANENLSQIEKIRQYIIINEPFSTDNGMLTPTMKLRRHMINENYGNQLDSLYKKN